MKKSYVMKCYDKAISYYDTKPMHAYSRKVVKKLFILLNIKQTAM